MKTNVTQRQVKSGTKHLNWKIAVVLFSCNLSPLCLLVQRHFMACKWFCRLGFVVVDVGRCYKLCFNWFPPADDEQRSMKIATISEAEIWISIFHRPLDSMGKNPSLLLNEWWTKDFFLSDTQSTGAGHFMVGRSPPTLSNCRPGIIFRYKNVCGRYKNALSSDWFGLNTCVSHSTKTREQSIFGCGERSG